MTMEIPPNGSRGARTMGGGMLRGGAAFMAGLFRLTGGRLGHMLLLSTVGAKSGEQRIASIRRFDDGEGRWLVVGSAGGSAHHPAWLYNVAKNPDQVWVEIGRERIHVRPELLAREERATAWRRVVAEAANFGKYETTTDREIPVVRLTRVP
jgi:deazaflavin-dependent oxidoreductase (nitroreductase family)